MLSTKFVVGCLFTALAVVIQLPQTYCRVCEPSFCGTSSGNILNISHPFRLEGDPEDCGDSEYELVCENNVTTVTLPLTLYDFPGFRHRRIKYHVEVINYDNFTIRVVDVGAQYYKNNTNNTCSSSLSQYSQSYPGFAYADGYDGYIYKMKDGDLIPHKIENNPVTVISCPHSVNSSLYVDLDLTGADPNCFNESSELVYSSSSTNDNYSYFPDNFWGGRHYYVIVGEFYSKEFRSMCKKESGFSTSLPLKVDQNHKLSFSEIHSALFYGFQLSWSSFKCPTCRSYPCFVGGDIYTSCSSDYCSIGHIPFIIYLGYYHKCGFFGRLLRIIIKFSSWAIDVIAGPTQENQGDQAAR